MDKAPTLTGRHLQILQHACGTDQHGRGTFYRKHFVTGEGSDDHDDCMALTDAGLMVRHVAPKHFGGMDYFAVNDAGRAYIVEHSPAPPKLSRSEQRYRDYLDADNGLSFGDWLKARTERARSNG